jgi:hypothetical protein
MGINMREMFGSFTAEKEYIKREIYYSLRDSTSRLNKYMEESNDESGVEDILSGKKYIPDVSSNYCFLSIVNKEENTKEEIHCSKDLKYFSYKIGRTDGSIRSMEYEYVDHRDCVLENVTRILSDVNTLLEGIEGLSSD